MNAKNARYTVHFFIAALLVVYAYALVYQAIGQDILSHSKYDAYTLQAKAWWNGRVDVPGPAWEIAEYGGRYYVSFPPFPSVIQFLLYPIFGSKTPDNLVSTLFGLAAFVLIYRLMMRRGSGGLASALMALLFTLGSNLFYLSLSGWVWYAAQTQSFFFSVLAVYLIQSPRRLAWYFAFLSLGIAFACRPFQILYTPLLIYMLYVNLGEGFKSILRGAKYVMPLAAMCLCVVVYNYIRFDNVFEFGHNYLEEFARKPQFSLAYVPGNFLEILKLPGTSAKSFWPMFNGTLFFLVNPAYVLLAVRFVKYRIGEMQYIYLLCLLIHFVLMLSHKTMGGWQFGSRYLVDMLPFMLMVMPSAIKQKNFVAWIGTLAAMGIVINVWGAIWFYTVL